MGAGHAMVLNAVDLNAVVLNPTGLDSVVLNPQEVMNQAEAFFAAGNLEEAERNYMQLADKPGWSAEAKNRLGIIAGFQAKLSDSRQYLASAVSDAPDRVDIRQNLLLTLERLGASNDALEQLLDIGVVQYNSNDYQGAVESFARGLAFRPGWPRAWANLSAALEANHQLPAALNLLFTHMMALEGKSAELTALLSAFISAYAQTLESTEAPLIDADKVEAEKIKTEEVRAGEVKVDNSQEIYPIDNDNLASAINTLGNIARYTGNVDLAHRAYAFALTLKPDFPVFKQNLAQVQLSVANFEHGWKNYEARLGIFDSTPERELSQPLWNDESLADKTLLLWAEQGYGDTIQMLRYVPILAKKAQRILLELPLELARLAFNNFAYLNNVDVLPRHAYRTHVLGNPAFDYHCPLMGIPHRLKVGLDDIVGAPYLLADEQDMVRWQSWLQKGSASQNALRIGIVWAGRPTHSRDQVRSLGLAQLASVLKHPGINWISLQVGRKQAQDMETLQGLDFFDPTDALRDFAETAALISQLDGIVSVDTAVTHIAGSLGVPAAVILPAVSDWRWMHERNDTPWYESLTLFRRPDDGPLPDALLQSVNAWLDKLTLSKTSAVDS
ncbi:MAG: glycosyltransferase family 9 protein [Methylotenera sp.]|nr:glycosyltransferase family 9 protein [Methylotenera sp.]